jgi:hypothetical protein
MTMPPWHMTHTACARYAYSQKWVREDIERATRELEELSVRVHYVEADRHGRELWRSPRADGYLRWVIDPRKAHVHDLPQVVWVGQSRPPGRIWAPKR